MTRALDQSVDWWEMAACRHGDPERFFPEGRALRHRVDAAKTVCAGCEVRARCLSWALTMDVAGVWGGYTLRERRQLREQGV